MTLPRPRLLSAVLPLLLPLAAAACADPLTPPPPGRFRFEVEYVNFAWGFSYHGYVVDEEGHVYSYDLGDTQQQPPAGDEFSAADLEAKYAHRRALAGSVSAAEVQSRYARVGDALAGTLTPEQGVCADAGTTRYTALIYNQDTGTYRRLLLRQNGDVARTNTSPAAAELFRWLVGVTTPGASSTSCDPFDG